MHFRMFNLKMELMISIISREHYSSFGTHLVFKLRNNLSVGALSHEQYTAQDHDETYSDPYFMSEVFHEMHNSYTDFLDQYET